MASEEPEVTELFDWDAERVDGVGDPASGFRQFLVMKGVATKREFSAEERRRLAAEGKALPDGSFPILNREDLKNAIRLVGLSKRPKGQVRRFIKRRAEALNATDLIPKEWSMKASKALNLGDGRGLLDLSATLQRVDEGIAAIRASIERLSDPDQLGSGATDPEPAEKARLAKSLADLEETRQTIAKAISMSQERIDAEREHDSTGPTGGDKPDLNPKADVDAVAKWKKKAKRAEKDAAKARKRWKKSEKARKDPPFAQRDDGGRWKKSDTRKALTNGQAGAVASALPGAPMGLVGAGTPAAAIKDKLSGTPATEAAVKGRDATRESLRAFFAASLGGK